MRLFGPSIDDGSCVGGVCGERCEMAVGGGMTVVGGTDGTEDEEDDTEEDGIGGVTGASNGNDIASDGEEGEAGNELPDGLSIRLVMALKRRLMPMTQKL